MSTQPNRPTDFYDRDAWEKFAADTHRVLEEAAYQQSVVVFLGAVKAWYDNKVQGEGKTGWVQPPFPTPPPGYTPPPAPAIPPPVKLSSHVGNYIGRGYYAQLEAETDPAKDGDSVMGSDGRTYIFVKGMIGGWYQLKQNA